MKYCDPLTVILPYASFKAKTRRYSPQGEIQENIGSFYQFALDTDEGTMEFERKGFQILESWLYERVKGFKDENATLKPLFQNLYNYSRKSIMISTTQQMLDTFLEPCAYYTTLPGAKEERKH